MHTLLVLKTLRYGLLADCELKYGLAVVYFKSKLFIWVVRFRNTFSKQKLYEYKLSIPLPNGRSVILLFNLRI